MKSRSVMYVEMKGRELLGDLGIFEGFLKKSV
jgi:hypothetical protein